MSNLNFTGLAAPLSPSCLASVAASLGVDLATVWAVISVETRGCGFMADRRPKILFERHVFSKQTGGRFDAREPGLSNPTPGGYSGSDSGEYDRLNQAMALNETAALNSASWGLAQVMGFNATSVGYVDAAQMVGRFVQSEDAQLQAMQDFISGKGLKPALRAKQWDKVALGYNGSNYAINQYDQKLAHFYARYSVGPLPDLHVRAVQMALVFNGDNNVGGVDGWFGDKAQKALLRFQGSAGLPLTGRPDDLTVAALMRRVGWEGGAVV